MDLPDNNPKTRFGVMKPNMFLVPPASKIYQALAMADGAKKYGPYNWRENKVTASIYLAAAQRHMDSWLDGEDTDPKSLVPHLGHAIACLGIIVDAIETGNVIDDRPQTGAAAALIDKHTRTLDDATPARQLATTASLNTNPDLGNAEERVNKRGKRVKKWDTESS